MGRRGTLASTVGRINKTAHVHGGQRLVLGLHDNHTGLNRSYLCKDKAAHATVIDKGFYLVEGTSRSNAYCVSR